MNKYLVRVRESNALQYNAEVSADIVNVDDNNQLCFLRKKVSGEGFGSTSYHQVAGFRTWEYYKMIVEEL